MLNHLRKHQQLVKKIHLSQPTVLHKTFRAIYPHECTRRPAKLRESKVSQFAFPFQGKEKQLCWSIRGDDERHAAHGEATMDPELNGYGSTWKGLTLPSHRAHCAEKKTSLHRDHAASTAPQTLAWLSTAPASQTKQEAHSHQIWESASFQAIIIIIIYIICIFVFSNGGVAISGELNFP